MKEKSCGSFGQRVLDDDDPAAFAVREGAGDDLVLRHVDVRTGRAVGAGGRGQVPPGSGNLRKRVARPGLGGEPACVRGAVVGVPVVVELERRGAQAATGREVEVLRVVGNRVLDRDDAPVGGDEPLNPVVARVGDVDPIARSDGEPGREAELAVGGAERPAARDEGPGGAEPLDPAVAGVRDIDVAGRVDRDAVRGVELPVPAAGVPHLRQKRSVQVELLDPVVAGIRDVGVARKVERDAERLVEPAVRRSLLAPGLYEFSARDLTSDPVVARCRRRRCSRPRPPRHRSGS